MTRNQPKNIDNEVKKIDSDKDIVAMARQRREDARKEQESIGALPGQRLVAAKIPGFESRWVNDTPGRVDALLKKGYSFVKAKKETGSFLTTDTGTAKSQIVGTAATGGALRAYLMVIPQELWEENQKIKEQITQTQADAYKGIERDADKLATPEGRSEIYKPL